LPNYASAPASSISPQLERLPLVTLYLTERCNSRCVTCDYWRHGRADMTLESVTRLVPSLVRLGTRTALISGGEPLLNPEWQDIARLLAANGLKLWLLTSGLSLAKHAHRASELFDAITVSMDGTQPATYAAIRGVNAFDKVCEGIRAVVDRGAPVGLRVTLQRTNYRELPQFVALARNLGVQSLSFLAVDVANPHAFGRTDEFAADVALRADDLPVLEQLLTSLERECADDFHSGLIAESPAKLRRIHQYFAALLGKASFPPVRCNAPEFSAVVGTRGDVQPCFFISGPPDSSMQDDLGDALNSEAMLTLRENIRSGSRPECARCVCSLWREPGHFATADFLPRGLPLGHRGA
jgi:MoaA/NifB/PqqE/SkfB family radical SAM enzyme